jgi:hypothetical protein
MSIETPAPVPTAPATPAPTPAPPAAATPPPAPAQEPTDWTAEARKWEARAKENKTAADELAALKAAQMTEAEKAAARTAELEAKVKGFETKEQVAAWKKQVADTTGVPAAALAGSTLEEIQAHAETLKPLIASAPPAPRGPLIPAEGKGGDAAAGVTQLTDADLASMTPQQINEARRAGRLARVLGVSS